jgi:glycolate oxidase
MAAPDALKALADAVGPALLTDPSALAAYRTDRSGWTTDEVPLAAVRARDVADVQATMRFATAHGLPVVPRGAGTGLAGGAVGSAGSIVIDVSGMDRVLEIHAADELAVVEPGVVTDDLAAALAPHGLWWPPDPASRAISTVGGNIATNAGGLLCAKYGVTRESVLGLAVVLADGTLIRTGHRTVKGVTGYDLTALLIGSEGTLGIVVEATLKLRRRSADPVVTIGAGFPTVVEAASAAAAITASGLRPAALELLDAASCAAIDAYLADVPGMPSLAGRGAFLLVQTDGPAALAESRRVAALIEAAGGTPEVAPDEAAGERLLQVRRSAHPAYVRLGEVLIEDVAVPRTRLPAMFAAIERISATYGLPIPTVAHAGDGNLHPNLVIPPGIPHEPGTYPDVVWAAAEELFRTAIELGGTLTGEHGVGVLKRRWLEDELGAEVTALSRRIKAAFDPQGILNPGKVFLGS